MRESLKFIIGIWTVLIVTLICSPPILADDVSAGDKAIALTINWRDDTPATRPESITIELYRHVDGEDVPMDSKTVTAADSISQNTWNVLFEYYYGPVWEYAFRITSSSPRTALYAYRLDESGNGTNHYTFDYYYETGKTEMRVETIWEDDNDAAGARPESVSADLISLSTGELERTVILSGDQDHWQATVTGLDEDPSNYYLVVRDLPADYSNVVTRGEDSNTYICTNTYTAASSTTELTTQEMLSGALIDAAESVDIENTNRTLRNIFIGCAAILCVVVLFVYIRYGRGKKEK